MATNPARDPTPGVHLLGPMLPGYETILTPAALEFIVDLTRRFGDRITSLLEARVARQRQLDDGALPDFLPETRAVREGQWRVTTIPADLQDRRVEITGPTDRKMIINALKSTLGAQAYANGNFDRAAELIDAVTTAADFETFITLPAYRAIR